IKINSKEELLKQLINNNQKHIDGQTELNKLLQFFKYIRRSNYKPGDKDKVDTIVKLYEDEFFSEYSYFADNDATPLVTHYNKLEDNNTLLKKIKNEILERCKNVNKTTTIAQEIETLVSTTTTTNIDKADNYTNAVRLVTKIIQPTKNDIKIKYGI